MESGPLVDPGLLKPIDTHAHLDQLADPAESLRQAKAAGVLAVVGVGMDLASNRRILEIAAGSAGLVWPALGAHPWNVKPGEWSANQEFLEANLDRATALGEVGLDYKVKIKKDIQAQTFGRALELAARLDKPVLVHARYSQDQCLDMLRAAGISRAVFHWFSGPLEILKKIIDAGYLVSATPALAYSPAHREALAQAPLDRILLETDCPVEYRSVASRPLDIFTTVRLLAELRKQTEEEITRLTTANALAFFNRPL
ncbi:MAG: TatD family hydrolase [Pseudomonadota bacterium]